MQLYQADPYPDVFGSLDINDDHEFIGQTFYLQECRDERKFKDDILRMRTLYLGYNSKAIYSVEFSPVKTNVALYWISRNRMDARKLWERIKGRELPKDYEGRVFFPMGLWQWKEENGVDFEGKEHGSRLSRPLTNALPSPRANASTNTPTEQ